MENKKRLAELVKELQHGNGAAFEEIYNLTNGRAFATALSIVKNRDDAEDLLQDAYLTVLDKIDTLEKPESFSGWFNIIVANKAKKFLQKAQPLLFQNDEEKALVLDTIIDEEDEYKPGLDVEKEDLRKDVIELINNLGDDQKTVILLYYYNEMSIKEIAQALEINENTVKSRLFQAKKKLSNGIQTLEKKDKKLFGIAPGPVIIWALRTTSDSAAASFAGSAASAGVLNAVTAASGAGASAAVGTAAGGIAAKFAALSLLQKVVAGVVAASVAAGTAVGTKKIVEYRKESASSAPVVETVTVWQNEKSGIFEVNTEKISENTEEISGSSGKDEKTKATTEKTTEKSSKSKKTSKTEKSAAEESSSLREEKPTEKSTSATATTEPPQTTTSSTTKPETTTASTTKKTTTAKRTTTTAKRTTTTTKRTTTTTKTTTATTTDKTTTTTKSPANVKINYVVTDGSGDDSTVTESVSAGTTITESMILGSIGSKYGNTLIRSGTYPVTAEPGSTYEYIVYVWND